MDMPITDVKRLSSLIFFHNITLLLQHLSLTTIITILQLSLSDYFELDSFLNLVAGCTDEVESSIFPESIIAPLMGKRRCWPEFFKVNAHIFSFFMRFLSLVMSQSIV